MTLFSDRWNVETEEASDSSGLSNFSNYEIMPVSPALPAAPVYTGFSSFLSTLQNYPILGRGLTKRETLIFFGSTTGAPLGSSTGASPNASLGSSTGVSSLSYSFYALKYFICGEFSLFFRRLSFCCRTISLKEGMFAGEYLTGVAMKLRGIRGSGSI